MQRYGNFSKNEAVFTTVHVVNIEFFPFLPTYWPRLIISIGVDSHIVSFQFYRMFLTGRFSFCCDRTFHDHEIHCFPVG